ncbi:MAG: ATP-dependent zinc metalloprotease FtsH, partial [Chloroflexi bacterium]|nr:ATP-dependent zinc metalloprotease FtsH [Chloroflexota bacterium]
AEEIDEEVHALIMTAYQRAKDVIRQHRDKLEQIARYLIQHETMDAVTLAQIFNEPAPSDVTSAPVPA